MKDPGLRIGFLSDGGVALDYGRRLSRLRWRRRFPRCPAGDLATEAEASRALSSSDRWVLVRDESALPTPGGPPEVAPGRVVLAASVPQASAPFVHTLRELEVTPRAPGALEPDAATCPALSFSVSDFPPRPGETVAGYVRRLLSPPTPHALSSGFEAISFAGEGRGAAAERPEVIRLLPPVVKRLLDVGCAWGEAGAAVRRAQPGVVVTGIEREPLAAEGARTRLDHVIEEEAIPALEELARAGERFDAFLFADVLEHLEDPIGALAAARALATPEATLVASVPNAGHISLVRDLVLGRFDPLPAGLADAGHLRWFTRASLADALDEAGWRAVSIDAFAGAPPPDPGPFLDLAAGWPDADPASLLAYQWLAVARPR